jgi:hypothetical protein
MLIEQKSPSGCEIVLPKRGNEFVQRNRAPMVPYTGKAATFAGKTSAKPAESSTVPKLPTA